MPTLRQKFLRRMNTKAQDLLLPPEDLRAVINAEYDSDLGAIRKVKGYEQVGDKMSVLESTEITLDADWNNGTHDSTEAVNNSLLLEGGVVAQDSNDDSHDVHGDNWIAQSFKATGVTLNKIAIYIDKVLGSTLADYDNFNDNSFDNALWTQTGLTNAVEQNGRLEFQATAPSSRAVTSDETDFNGMKFDIVPLTGGTSGETSSSHYCQLATSGGLQMRVYLHIQAGNSIIRVDGSDVQTISGTTHTWEFKPVGNNVEVYASGVLRHTVVGQTFAGAGQIEVSNAPPSGTQGFYVDNIEKYSAVTALTDLDVRIEGDSSDAPDGSAITNGTATIDDAQVSEESINLIEADFSTDPTLVIGTTFWMVLKQTGGDANNKYRIYKQNSDIYTDGNTQVSTDGGSSWDDDGDAPSDLAFRIYQGFATSGNWISANQTLASGQTMSQLIIDHTDLSVDDKITRVDILNTSNVIQSSNTTAIVTGIQTILRGSDFDSGLGFTNGNSFRIKITLAGSASVTPSVDAIFLDSPETKILELSPLYQASGTRRLMAVISGTIKNLVSSLWVDVKDNLTTGLEGGSEVFSASKKTIQESGTADSGTLTTLVDTPGTEPAFDEFQGHFIKITGGTGVDQVRRIQSHTGTSTSTSTSSTTTTTTSTSTSTTTTTTTSTTTSTTTTTT